MIQSYLQIKDGDRHLLPIGSDCISGDRVWRHRCRTVLWSGIIRASLLRTIMVGGGGMNTP